MSFTYLSNVNGTHGTTSATASFTCTAGDVYVFFVVNKPYSSVPVITGVAATLLGEITSGTTANGNGVGSTRTSGYGFIATGSETLITATVASGSPTMIITNRWRPTGGPVYMYGATGADTDNSTTDIDVTCTTMLNYVSGDAMSLCYGINDNINIVSSTFTFGGFTAGTEYGGGGGTVTTAVGNDAAGYEYRLDFDPAGPQTSPLHVTGTAETASASEVSLVEIRMTQQEPPPFFPRIRSAPAQASRQAVHRSYSWREAASGLFTPDRRLVVA